MSVVGTCSELVMFVKEATAASKHGPQLLASPDAFNISVYTWNEDEISISILPKQASASVRLR